MSGHWAGIAVLRQYSFRRRLFGWKLFVSAAVALLPALIAFVFVNVAPTGRGAPTPYRFYGEYLAPVCLYFVAPFISMLTMLPVLGELYERGAVGYLLTRPMPRWVPVAGLFQGGVLAMLPLAVLAAVLPALILSPLAHGVELRFWLQRVAGLTGLLWLGGSVYGSLCLFLGVWSRKAILWALFLLIFWGSVAGSLPGALRVTSLHRYLFSLMRSWLDVQNARVGMTLPDPDPPADFASLGILTAAGALFLWLAYRAMRRRDIL